MNEVLRLLTILCDETPPLFTELIIEDFDEEQVWAGVELLNRAKFPEFSSQVSNF